MKLVNALFGLAAVRVSGDAVAPLKGVVVKDLIDAIGRRYEFATKPPVQTAAQGQPMTFQGGAFKMGEQRIPIIQLGLVTNGDFVMAQTKDQADAILSDLINFFDETFEYRYKSTVVSRIFRTFDQATASVCMTCG